MQQLLHQGKATNLSRGCSLHRSRSGTSPLLRCLCHRPGNSVALSRKTSGWGSSPTQDRGILPRTREHKRVDREILQELGEQGKRGFYISGPSRRLHCRSVHEMCPFLLHPRPQARYCLSGSHGGAANCAAVRCRLMNRQSMTTASSKRRSYYTEQLIRATLWEEKHICRAMHYG